MDEVKAPKTITVKGIKVAFDPEALDDFELVDMIDDVNEGNVLKAPKVFRRILGDDGYAKVMDGLRNEKGRVPGKAATEFLTELMKRAAPNS